jgi:hypothetical protein
MNIDDDDDDDTNVVVVDDDDNNNDNSKAIHLKNNSPDGFKVLGLISCYLLESKYLTCN